MAAPSIESKGDGRYLIQGELDMQTVSAFWQQTERLFAEMPAEVCFDLSGVTRSDSAGLALLLEWMRTAKRSNIQLYFQNLPTQTQDIARLSELLDLLPLRD
jgi:phospholipid transport system transporter-binding protein